MLALRHARQLARFVLVWFALSVGAAIASPLIQPKAIELVCSASGVMKVLVKNADGSTQEVNTPMLDCPLCAPMGAPPPAIHVFTQPEQPLSYALQTLPAARIAALTAAPPPGRGPPLHS